MSPEREKVAREKEREMCGRDCKRYVREKVRGLRGRGLERLCLEFERDTVFRVCPRERF